MDGILCNKRDCFSAVVEGSNTVFAFLPHQKKAEKTQFKHQLPWRSTVKITRNPSWQSPRALHLTLSRNFHATPHHLKEFLEAKDSDSIVRHWVESSGLMAQKWFNPVLKKWQGLVESFRKMLLFPMFSKNRYTVYQRPTKKQKKNTSFPFAIWLGQLRWPARKSFPSPKKIIHTWKSITPSPLPSTSFNKSMIAACPKVPSTSGQNWSNGRLPYPTDFAKKNLLKICEDLQHIYIWIEIEWCVYNIYIYMIN